MPDVRIGAQICRTLKAALARYLPDIDDYIREINKSAALVGLRSEDYVPEDLARERESIARCIRIIDLFLEHDGLVGRPVSRDDLATMGSALLLYRDELQLEIDRVTANPLAPPQAALPIAERIAQIDKDREAFWKQYGEAPSLSLVRELRARKKGLLYPRPLTLEALLDDGEGQETEFIESFPKNAHDLAKEVAAFGTSNAGTILLGVTNAGKVVGLADTDKPEGRDRVSTRIEGVCSNVVTPSLVTRINFEEHPNGRVARISVPKGPEAVYYSHDTPYFRHGSLSRPAHWQEVQELIRLKSGVGQRPQE